MTGSGEKARDFRSAIRTLLAYLKPLRLSVDLVVVFAIASTAFAIVSPRILGDVTNIVVNGYSGRPGLRSTSSASFLLAPAFPPVRLAPCCSSDCRPRSRRQIPADQRARIAALDLSHRPTVDFAAIGRLVVILVVLYLASAAFAYIQGFVMTGVAQRVTFDLRQDAAEKINRLPLRYFDSKTHGEVLSRITNDVDTVSQTLNQSLSQIVTSVITLIGIFIMMLTISWQLTLVAAIILPVSVGLIRLIIGRPSSTSCSSKPCSDS